MSGFVSATQMQVTIPAGVMQGGGGFVSVVHTQPSGKLLISNELPLFLNPSNSAPLSPQSSLGTDPTQNTRMSNKVELTTTGTGAFAVASFGANPAGRASFAAADRWFDPLIDQASSISQVEIKDCDLNGGSGLRWWQGSQPALGDLSNGSLFAVTRDMQLSPIAPRTPIDEGGTASVSGTILNPSTDSMGLNVDWGDAHTDALTLPAKSGTYAVTHRYLDNPRGSGAQGAYPVKVQLTDSHGTVVSSASTSVTVRNVAPTVDADTDVQSTSPNWPINLYVSRAEPTTARRR